MSVARERAKHYPFEVDGEQPDCFECGQEWPCMMTRCLDVITTGAETLAALNEFIVMMQTMPDDDPLLMEAFRTAVGKRDLYTVAVVALEQS